MWANVYSNFFHNSPNPETTQVPFCRTRLDTLRVVHTRSATGNKKEQTVNTQQPGWVSRGLSWVERPTQRSHTLHLFTHWEPRARQAWTAWVTQTQISLTKRILPTAHPKAGWSQGQGHRRPTTHYVGFWRQLWSTSNPAQFKGQLSRVPKMRKS